MSCRCCGQQMKNGGKYCSSCWLKVYRQARKILERVGKPMDIMEIAHEIFKEMDIADLKITYNIIRGKNTLLKRKVKACLQRGPKSTNEIKNWLNEPDKKKRGKSRLRYGAITQQLVNVLGKSLDFKELDKSRIINIQRIAGTYEEKTWILAQHLEFIGMFQKRL